MAISMLQTEFLPLMTPDDDSDCIDIMDAILTGNTCHDHMDVTEELNENSMLSLQQQLKGT